MKWLFDIRYSRCKLRTKGGIVRLESLAYRGSSERKAKSSTAAVLLN